MKKYSSVDKFLVVEYAGGENLYEQYLGVLGGLNIPNDEVSEKVKLSRLIT